MTSEATGRGTYLIYLTGVMVVLAFVLTIRNAAFNAPMLVLLVAGVYGLWKSWRELWSLEGWRWFVVIWACFWIPQVISLFDAFEPGRAATTTLAFLRFPLVAAALFLAVQRWPQLYRWILAGVVLWCFFVGVDLLIQLITGKDLLGYQSANGRLTGPSGEHKIGFVLGVAIPVLFETARRAGRFSILIWAAALLCAAMVIASGHRGGWLSLLVGTVIWSIFYLSTLSVRRVLGVMIAGTVISALLTPIVIDKVIPKINRMDETLQVLKGDFQSWNSVKHRFGIWEAGVSIYRDHLVNGIGPRGFRYVLGSDPDLQNMASGIATHPHLIGLEIATETGSIGVAGYLLALFLLIKAAWRRRRNAESAWLIAGLAALLPFNMSLAIYSTYWSHVTFLILMIGFSISRTDPPVGRKIQ